MTTEDSYGGQIGSPRIEGKAKEPASCGPCGGVQPQRNHTCLPKCGGFKKWSATGSKLLISTNSFGPILRPRESHYTLAYVYIYFFKHSIHSYHSNIHVSASVTQKVTAATSVNCPVRCSHSREQSAVHQFMEHWTFSPNETMVGAKTRMSAREEEKKR